MRTVGGRRKPAQRCTPISLRRPHLYSYDIYIVMAYVVMAYVVLAYIAMAYVAIGNTVMADIAMT